MFLLDVHIPEAIAKMLEAEGHQVQRGSQIFPPGTPDEAVAAYARERGVEWKDQVPEYSESVTYNIGGDSVTVDISDDCTVVKVQAIRGDIGVSVTANIEDNSVRSSMFTSRALKREANIN